jgi:DNA-binding FrmR family transcriptional regulator
VNYQEVRIMVEVATLREGVHRRLKRIEGQVQGLQRMLEADRYCIDILHQIQAAKAALTKVETELLRAHAHECVDEALQTGTMADKRQKIVELVELFERVRR